MISSNRTSFSDQESTIYCDKNQNENLRIEVTDKKTIYQYQPSGDLNRQFGLVGELPVGDDLTSSTEQFH